MSSIVSFFLFDMSRYPFFLFDMSRYRRARVAPSVSYHRNEEVECRFDAEHIRRRYLLYGMGVRSFTLPFRLVPSGHSGGVSNRA